MPGQAFVTVATRDEYAIGSVVLGESLRKTGTSRELVILITEDVSLYARQLLSDVYDHVYLTTELCSHDDLTLSLLGRPELGITFTKLHCWRLTQYEKCVFLDADTLVLQSCDELFERDELSATPDTGWPDCFNSGVFVFRPSLDTYARLVTLAMSKRSFDGGDQGLLNSFFGDWRGDMSRRLPFIYNVVPSTSYTYAPAYRHHSSGVKIVHFAGGEKPWSVSWMTESGNVQAHHQHAFDMNVPVLQMWMNLFREKVLHKLPTIAQDEIKRKSEMTVNVLLQRINDGEIRQFDAPPQWQQADSLIEEYYPEHAHQHLQKPNTQSPFQISHYEVPRQNSPDLEHKSVPEIHPADSEAPPPPSPETNRSANEYMPHWEAVSQHEQHGDGNQVQISYQEPADPHWEALLWHQVQTPWDPPSPPANDYSITSYQQPQEPAEPTFSWYGSNEAEQSQSIHHSELATHTIQPQPVQDVSEKDTSREPTSDGSIPEQFPEDIKEVCVIRPETEEESLHRMKSWEEGRIDFMGRDNFDNIWKRLESLYSDKGCDNDESEPNPDTLNETYDKITSEISGSISSLSLFEGNETGNVDTEKWTESIVDEIEPHREGDLTGMFDWQEGRIDYCGKDRSDNIMKRLDMIFSGKLVLPNE